MPDAATTHVRVNRSLLAVAERRVLVWLALRLPARIHSDHLTALSVVGTALASAAFALARVFPLALVGVAVGLAVNWFGDSLDGTLARLRRQERPRYGFYVDHVLDVVGAAVLMGGMAVSGYMTPLVALGVLVAYLLVSAEVFLATAAGGDFRLSFVRIGPTELRLLISAGAPALLLWPDGDAARAGPRAGARRGRRRRHRRPAHRPCRVGHADGPSALRGRTAPPVTRGTRISA